MNYKEFVGVSDLVAWCTFNLILLHCVASDIDFDLTLCLQISIRKLYVVQNSSFEYF